MAAGRGKTLNGPQHNLANTLKSGRFLRDLVKRPPFRYTGLSINRAESPLQPVPNKDAQPPPPLFYAIFSMATVHSNIFFDDTTHVGVLKRHTPTWLRDKQTPSVVFQHQKIEPLTGHSLAPRPPPRAHKAAPEKKIRVYIPIKPPFQNALDQSIYPPIE